MSAFTGAEEAWSARLGNLRNVVRQHVIASQIAEHLGGVETVLDVGCGQGTQAIQLARRGIAVTGVDPSPALLEQFRQAADAEGLDVQAARGEIDCLDEPLGERRFDLVCAHGLLMYLDDAREGIARLVERTRPGGLVSFTVRNGDALAYRPGIRGDYPSALGAFESSQYVNELGVGAQAHTRAQAMSWCEEFHLTLEAWYGVRVFTDALPASAQPEDVDLVACLTAEIEAGRRDPYRALGSMLHFLMRRDDSA